MEKKFHIHVLSNTHWDREWYMSHEKYLARLVELCDRVLEILEKEKEYIFICDGQFSMVDDYLQARPENRSKVEQFVSEGRLEVGPWFTQPLETLVSGEAMVRNLHYGIEGSEKLGKAMRFSYEVDEFGHASQTPQILKGFGIDAALAWRGMPAGSRSALEWVSPDGSSVIMFYANTGYGEATNLPMCEEDYVDVIDGVEHKRGGLKRRVEHLKKIKQEVSDVNTHFWLNGIDHSFAQPDVLQVIEKINALFPELEVKQTTCEAFYDAIMKEYAETGAAMQRVEGELMYTGEQLLESTHACHPRQKKKHYITERFLERHFEPSVTLSWLSGFDNKDWAQRRAWKYVLENHAHDTLGCTSVNEVYEEAMARYGCALSLATQISDQAQREVMSCVADFPSLFVFNTSSFDISGVKTFELDIPMGYGTDRFELEDEEGNKIPFVITDKTPIMDVRFNPRQGHPTRVKGCHIKAMAEFPTVKAFGWRQFKFSAGTAPVYYKNRPMNYLSQGANVLENEFLKCTINPNGTVDMLDKASGKLYPSQFTFEDSGDVFNVYVHIPPMNNRIVYSTGCASRITKLYDNALGTAYEVKLTMEVPAGKGEFDCRSSQMTNITITNVLTLLKGERHLRSNLTIHNTAEEHRLRALFPTYIGDATKSRGGQPFDVVERDIHCEENIDGLWEQPYATHPMQDICDVAGSGCGLTVAAEGIYEYECIDNAERALALTVVRSNNCIDEVFGQGEIYDLTEAENIGEISYKLALFPHDGDWREVYGNAIGFLTDPVVALNRAPEVSTMTDYRKPAVSIPGCGSAVAVEGSNVMITAIKKAYGSDSLIVRVLNYSDKAEDAAITLTFPGKAVAAVYAADLDEHRTGEIAVQGNRFCVTLKKAQIATFEITMK